MYKSTLVGITLFTIAGGITTPEAHADIVALELSGVLEAGLLKPVDRLDGATLTVRFEFDLESTYSDLGLGNGVSGANALSASVTISGSGVADNNTTTQFDEPILFVPFFFTDTARAGLFPPNLGEPQFTAGNGTQWTMPLDMFADPDAFGTMAGDSLEFEHFDDLVFAPSPSVPTIRSQSNDGFSRVYNFAPGTFSITATLVPAPSVTALFGLAGIATMRRRR